MSFRIAYDNEPDNPNPHAWELQSIAFPTEEAATHFAESEAKEMREHYGDEETLSWIVVSDRLIESNIPKQYVPERSTDAH